MLQRMYHRCERRGQLRRASSSSSSSSSTPTPTTSSSPAGNCVSVRQHTLRRGSGVSFFSSSKGQGSSSKGQGSSSKGQGSGSKGQGSAFLLLGCS